MIQKMRLGVYGVTLDQSKILLVDKVDGLYKGLLDLPGGGVEFGESPKETLKREFLEEVGLSFKQMILLDNLSYLFEAPESRMHFHHLGQIYLVKELQPEQVSETEPHGWYPLETIDLKKLTPFAFTALTRLIHPYITKIE